MRLIGSKETRSRRCLCISLHAFLFWKNGRKSTQLQGFLKRRRPFLTSHGLRFCTNEKASPEPDFSAEVISMQDDSSIRIPFRTQQFLLLAVQTGSFHKAAKASGVHPSALARHIDRLETDLGVKLLDRSRNTFSVTEPGRLFLREIHESMSHAVRAWDIARYQAHIEQGPFRLGYSGYVNSRLLPVLERLAPPVSQVAQDHSLTGEFRIVLEAGMTIQLVEDVLRGRLHASFGVQPIIGDDLWIKPVAREPFCLCVSKNHRLAKQSSVLARDMDGEMVFFFPRAIHPALYDRTLDYVARTGAKALWKEVIWFTHAMEIVAHNLGVALLPRSATRHSHMGVVFKPITDQLLWIETALFTRSDRQSNRTQQLLDILLLQLRSLPPDR